MPYGKRFVALFHIVESGGSPHTFGIPVGNIVADVQALRQYAEEQSLFVQLRACVGKELQVVFPKRAVGFIHRFHLVAAKNDELSADRKSTRLNSSHANISYAVFC